MNQTVLLIQVTVSKSLKIAFPFSFIYNFSFAVEFPEKAVHISLNSDDNDKYNGTFINS